MVPPAELVKITQMEEDELISLHRGFGMAIRNNFESPRLLRRLLHLSVEL
jgi:hypothetical protein